MSTVYNREPSFFEPSTNDAADADAEWCWSCFFRCSSFNPSSLDASTIDASEDRIHPSAEDPADQVDQVDQVDQADQADQVDPVHAVDQGDEALSKMKPPSEEAVGDHCEAAAIVDTDVDGSHITQHAIDGNDPAVLVKLEKDAKESKTDADTDDSKGSEVQYNAKENTAKETEENEKHLEENTKDFEKVGEVAEKVADEMVVEVMSSH